MSEILKNKYGNQDEQQNCKPQASRARGWAEDYCCSQATRRTEIKGPEERLKKRRPAGELSRHCSK